MKRTVRQAKRLRGTIRIPGDKSISHRAAILGALANGRTVARHFLQGADTEATLACLRSLGVTCEVTGGALAVDGAGLDGLRESADVLDCANSGTTMRLLAGALSGQPFLSVLTGDASLRSRPMERVAAPLREMGATVLTREGGLAPVAIRGGGLRAIHYRSPVASAQVKSAVLLAGLYAEGTTVVEEPSAQGGSRDHTERMLSAMGVDVRREGGAVSVAPPPGGLRPLDVAVPGDMSSAAFWIALAVAHPDAELRLTGVGVNPTRTGLIDALREMGGEIEIEGECVSGGEPVADVVARSSRLRGATFGGDLIPRMIDEILALAVAAVFAEGRTEIRDAAELRVKESDRVATVALELRKLGARIEELPDGMIIEGAGALSGAAVDGHGDHRLAMTLGVAGLLVSGETTIAGAEAVEVSYRDFWDHVHAVAAV